MKLSPESLQIGVWTLYFIFLLIGVYGLVGEWRRIKAAGGLPAGTLKPWAAGVGEVFVFLGVWLLSFLVLPQIGFKIAGLAYPEVNLVANPVYAVGFYQPLVLALVFGAVLPKHSKLRLASGWNAAESSALLSRLSLRTNGNVWSFFGILLVCVCIAGLVSQCVPLLVPSLKELWAQNQILVDNLRDLEYPSVLFWAVPSIVVFTPIVEEIFFRAGVYRLLKSKMPAIPAALLTGFCFAILHDSLSGILPLAMLSCVLCYAYERTGKLAVPIILHGLFNLNTLLMIFAGTEL